MHVKMFIKMQIQNETTARLRVSQMVKFLVPNRIGWLHWDQYFPTIRTNRKQGKIEKIMGHRTGKETLAPGSETFPDEK